MGIVSNAIRRDRSGVRNPKQWLVDFFGGGNVSESGVSVNEDTVMSESAVWCAVMFLASNLASLPCPVLEKTGRQRVKQKDHFLHQRLNVMANPEMTAMVWREVCIYYLSLWGTAYSIIVRDYVGRVTALWPVHPDNVTQIRRVNGRLKYTVVSVNNRGTAADPDVFMKETEYDQDDILRIPGVGNGFLGLRMIDAAKDSIGLVLAMRTYANLFFKNGANMGVVLEHPGVLGETAAKNLRRHMENAYSGLGRSHKVMVAEEGMKVATVGVEPEKSQLLEARQFSINDVARWFNLPPHVLKDLSNANYSNMQQQSLELVTYTFRPWFVKLEQSYEAFLFRDEERGRLSVRHNANALMRGDEKSRAEYYRMMFNVGAYSPNRILELEDENPIEAPWADKTYLQLNLVPTDMIEEVTRNQMALAGGSGASDRSVSRGREHDPAQRALPAVTPEQRAGDPDDGIEVDGVDFSETWGDPETEEQDHVQGLVSLEKQYVVRIASMAKSVVAFEVRQVLARVDRYLEDDRGWAPAQAEYRESDLRELLVWLERFYIRELPDRLAADFAPVIQAYSRLIAKESGRMIGMDYVVTDELEQFVTEYLDVYAVRHCGSSLGQLKSLVKTTPVNEDLAVVMQQRLAEWQDTRPKKIADDEAVRVANAVAKETWRQQGVTRLQWVTQGSQTCPFCRQLNGKTVGIQAPFLDKDDVLTGSDGRGNYMRLKGRKGHPPIHKGCVCAIVPVDAGNRIMKDPVDQAKEKDGRHHGAYLKLTDQTADQVRQSLASFQRNVAVHLEKIADPEKVKGFSGLNEQAKASLLEHKWPSDIIRNRQQAKIAQHVLEEKTK